MSTKDESLKAKLDADIPPTFELILDTHQLEVSFIHNFISELYQVCYAPVNSSWNIFIFLNWVNIFEWTIIELMSYDLLFLPQWDSVEAWASESLQEL